MSLYIFFFAVEFSFLPAAHVRSAWPAGPKIAIHFPCLFVVRSHLLCVHLHVNFYRDAM